MQEPRSDEEIRRIVGEEGPSWRRTTDMRLFRLFVYAACIAAVWGAISTGILLHFSLLGLAVMTLLGGLAYGVYKMSPLCAIVLFICGALLTAAHVTGEIPGVLGNFPVGFLAALLLGVVGTFATNKRRKRTA